MTRVLTGLILAIGLNLTVSKNVLAQDAELGAEKIRIQKTFDALLEKIYIPDNIKISYISYKDRQCGGAPACMAYKSQRFLIFRQPTTIFIKPDRTRHLTDDTVLFLLTHEIGHYFDVELDHFYARFEEKRDSRLVDAMLNQSEAKADALVIYFHGEDFFKRTRLDLAALYAKSLHGAPDFSRERAEEMIDNTFLKPAKRFLAAVSDQIALRYALSKK